MSFVPYGCLDTQRYHRHQQQVRYNLTEYQEEGTMQKTYRIFEVIDSRPATLFHGNNGSRKLRVHQWEEIQDRGPVSDGASNTSYRAGWHTVPSRADAEAYLLRFKKPRHLIVCPVRISGAVWEKEHSPAPVVLSTEQFIDRSDWTWELRRQDDLDANDADRLDLLHQMYDRDLTYEDIAAQVKCNPAWIVDAMLCKDSKYNTVRRHIRRVLA